MRATLIVALCAVAASCVFGREPEPRRVNAYLADNRDISSVRRIMIMPFMESSGVNADLARVREAFVSELLKIQRFEIVPMPEHAREKAEINRSLGRGRLSTRALVSLSERYNLDGIMLGTVTSYRAYTPPRLGLRIQLMSIHSGEIIWAAEGNYDAADTRTIEDLNHYFMTSQADDETGHGVDLYWISPTKYAAYVSARLVSSWNASLRRRP